MQAKRRAGFWGRPGSYAPALQYAPGGKTAAFVVSKADMEENAYESSIFIHSDEDYRCPSEQGLQMYTALAVQGVPTRLCLFHGENHELSRSGKPKHRVRRLTEITKWFERFAKTE